ncbi:MAG: hypothetical protein P0Y52_10065 [Candidatus Brevundimonas phytovorans]|nr:hypothetical protein [Brevundimonas sp.]WEK56890.1 MAG: hypothetical protein P0Y52_10065 [Brevundimonas sp.]
MNRKGLMTAAALAVATTVAAGAAQAECDLASVRVIADGVVLRYDPFDQDDARGEISVRLNANQACADARIEMAIAPNIDSIGAAGTLEARDGANGVTVQVASQMGPARVVTDPLTAFARPAPAGRLSASGLLTGPGLRVIAPYGQIVPPGRYRARATLLTRAIDAEGAATDVVETPFYVEIEVQPSFRLAAGVEQRLFLGELTPGADSQPMTFNAYSNVGYDLKVRSDHQWRMTLDGSNAANAPGVPYRVAISDRLVRRESGEASVLRFDEPRAGRRSHTLKATALPFDPQPAGAYQDFITIEISPRLGGGSAPA